MIDIGFNSFLTLKIIKIAWVTSIVLAVLFTVVGMAYGFIRHACGITVSPRTARR